MAKVGIATFASGLASLRSGAAFGLVGSAIGMLGGSILARAVSLEVRGEIAVALVAFTFITHLADAGMSVYLPSVALSGAESESGALSVLIRHMKITSPVTSIAAGGLSFFLFDRYEFSAFVVFVGMLFADQSSRLLAALAKAIRPSGLIFALRIVPVAVMLILYLALPLASEELDSEVIVLMTLASYGVGSLVATAAYSILLTEVLRSPRVNPTESAKSAYRKGIRSLLGEIRPFDLLRIDLVLASTMGVKSAGLYAVASAIPLGARGLLASLLPAVWMNPKDSGTPVAVILLSVLGAAASGIASWFLLEPLFGENYADAVGVAVFLSPGVAFWGWRMVRQEELRLAGNGRSASVIETVLLLSWLLLVLLRPLTSLTQVAIAASMSSVVVAAVSEKVYRESASK